MQRPRGGFTIIEVMLFIAISGFLIVGLMVGTSATIARQRYNDSVQDLAEYFRREYSAVINPENGRSNTVDSSICHNTDGSSSVSGTGEDTEGANRGRSGCLLYGRLITVGEVDGDSHIYSYDVIGRELSDYDAIKATALKDALDLAAINVLVRSDPRDPSSTTCSYQPVGVYQYTPQWLAKVEKTANSDPVELSILIVRSPVNGSVHTLVYDSAVSVQEAIDSSCTAGAANALLGNEAVAQFAAADINMCVGSDDLFALDGSRRNVRIARDGHNGSAVEIAEQDSEDNVCQ